MESQHADTLNQAIRLLGLRHRARAAALLAPLGLHAGQEVLLLALARNGPMIQAQVSEALAVEPPSVTIMIRKLEAIGHVRRTPVRADRRASIVELTDSGRELVEQVEQLWCALADETVTGLPSRIVAELPAVLETLAADADTRRAEHPHRRQRAPHAEWSRTSFMDQGVASTGDYEPSALAFVREHVEQIMRTGTTDGVTMNERSTVLMTYRGFRTGKVRKTPLMRVEHEKCYAAVASNGAQPSNPQWYASLLAEPVVALQDGAITREYRAREVFGSEKDLWWRRAVDAYPDYADYQRKIDRQIPVLVLEPIGGRTASR